MASFATAVRVEWAKARARAERWTEEVELVHEEMRRTIEYCRWQSRWWAASATERQGLPLELQEGVAAYACEHADLEERFARDLERRWDVIRRRAKEFIDSGFVDDETQAHIDPAASVPSAAETVTLNLRELQSLDNDGDDDDD